MFPPWEALYALISVRLPLTVVSRFTTRFQTAKRKGEAGCGGNFCIFMLVVVPGLNKTAKTHRIVHFKGMQVIVCRSFLNKVDKKKLTGFQRAVSGHFTNHTRKHFVLYLCLLKCLLGLSTCARKSRTSLDHPPFYQIWT